MFISIAGYKFVSTSIIDLLKIRDQLKEKALQLEIKGTILLSTEGINAFVAGYSSAIEAYQQFIASFPEFADLHFKKSESEQLPFARMLVRIKNEIISMGREDVKPEQKTAPYIDPETLKQWYDEQRDFVILDTRNDYEVAVGTFDNALDLNIENFRQFPDAVKLLPSKIKKKPIVTFCTGGIRCEKAAEYMQQQGFTEVYQLQGGILNYFEKIGSAHYQGECFVFDKRLTVDAALNPTKTQYCLEHQKNTAKLECPYCLHLQQSRKDPA